jgi:hypothetical protein
MEAVRTKEMECLYCGHKVDHVSSIEEGHRIPKLGDFSLCIRCSGLMVFIDDSYTMRIPNEEDLKAFYNDRERATEIFKTSLIILSMGRK